MNIGYASTDWGIASRGSDIGKPKYGLGGSVWVRCIVPGKELHKRGHDYRVGRISVHNQTGELLIADPNSDDHWNGFDIIFLQRWMAPTMIPYIQKAKSLGQKIVNDLDDWVWSVPSTNLAWMRWHPINSGEINLKAYDAILAESDLITTSTPRIAELAQQRWPKVPVACVRNAVDTTLYEPNEPNEKTEGLTVGWVGGTPWRGGDLEILQGVLGPWLRKTKSRFYHGGHAKIGTPAAEMLALGEDIEVSTKPLCPVERYAELMKGIDIGIVPLSPIDFNNCKSSLKGMEYSAAGIPFIASESSSEYRWMSETGAGMLAKKPRNWLKALDQLREPEFRRQQGMQNLEIVKKHHDITARVAEWEQVFQKLM